MSKNNKSIIIIDTPSNCVICPLSFYTELYDEHHCRGTEGTNGYSRTIDIYGAGAKKPNWCPLSSLPEKKNLKEYIDAALKTNTTIDNILAYQYAQGWNDFWQEINNKDQ